LSESTGESELVEYPLAADYRTITLKRVLPNYNTEKAVSISPMTRRRFIH
jgi:hypothetical protein